MRALASTSTYGVTCLQHTPLRARASPGAPGSSLPRPVPCPPRAQFRVLGFPWASQRGDRVHVRGEKPLWHRHNVVISRPETNSLLSSWAAAGCCLAGPLMCDRPSAARRGYLRGSHCVPRTGLSRPGPRFSLYAPPGPGGPWRPVVLRWLGAGGTRRAGGRQPPRAWSRASSEGLNSGLYADPALTCNRRYDGSAYAAAISRFPAHDRSSWGWQRRVADYRLPRPGRRGRGRRVSHQGFGRQGCPGGA
jgi:hypothetical protein